MATQNYTPYDHRAGDIFHQWKSLHQSIVGVFKCEVAKVEDTPGPASRSSSIKGV